MSRKKPFGAVPPVNPIHKKFDNLYGGNTAGTRGAGYTAKEMDALADLERGGLVNGSTSADYAGSTLYRNQGAEYLEQLLYLLQTTSLDTGANADEYNYQIYQLMLEWIKTQEQREYDRSVVDEQRGYDSPMSQLQRLMATGMSRDAALAAISGGQQSPLVGSGASTTVPETLSPQELRTQQIQNGLGIFNAGMSVIGAVGNLVSIGFTVPQAKEQLDILKAQNYMTQEQVKSYKAVNGVTNYVQDLVNQGVVSADEIQSLSNADDMYNYLFKNRDNENFKQLFDSGMFDSAFGSVYGREMFNNHWGEVRESGTSGDRLDNIIQKELFDKLISNFTADTLYNDMQLFIATYQDEIQKIRNDVELGKIEIKIGDKQIEKLAADTELVQSQTRGQDTQNEILANDKLVSDISTGIVHDFWNADNAANSTMTNREVFSRLHSYELFDAMQRKRVYFSDQNSFNKYYEMLRNDRDTAFSLAAVKQYVSGYMGERAGNFNPLEVNLKYSSFVELCNRSGLLDGISVKTTNETKKSMDLVNDVLGTLLTKGKK